MIGITSQIQSEGGGNDGVGFAVPSNTVKSIAAQLISNGKAQHALLGVTPADTGERRSHRDREERQRRRRRGPEGR